MSDGNDLYSTVVKGSSYNYLNAIAKKSYTKSSSSSRSSEYIPGIWLSTSSTASYLPGILSSVSSNSSYLPGIYT